MARAGWDGFREGRCRGRAAGPAAQPPRRAPPACFGAAETACGRSLRFAANLRRGREGFCRRGVGAGPGSSGGPVQGAGRRPGGAAAEAGFARLFRRSRNGLRP